MRGRVYLVGAGPGDPELMTLKAARVLGEADVILIDDLVHRGCLRHARPEARILEVGKRGGRVSTPQVFIERLLVSFGREGKVVARLKGGDPFVFGRGGEELAALLAAGIEVEVVPGITAGIGVPAALGIPVTHRGVARGVTFVTGHAGLEWQALVRARTTLVIYMGLAKVEQIAAGLLGAGMDPATPGCIVENGTLPRQRERFGTLATLRGEGLEGPALIVIGDVVRFAALARRWPRAWAA